MAFERRFEAYCAKLHIADLCELKLQGLKMFDF